MPELNYKCENKIHPKLWSISINVDRFCMSAIYVYQIWSGPSRDAIGFRFFGFSDSKINKFETIFSVPIVSQNQIRNIVLELGLNRNWNRVHIGSNLRTQIWNYFKIEGIFSNLSTLDWKRCSYLLSLSSKELVCGLEEEEQLKKGCRTKHVIGIGISSRSRSF